MLNVKIKAFVRKIHRSSSIIGAGHGGLGSQLNVVAAVESSLRYRMALAQCRVMLICDV